MASTEILYSKALDGLISALAKYVTDPTSPDGLNNVALWYETLGGKLEDSTIAMAASDAGVSDLLNPLVPKSLMRLAKLAVHLRIISNTMAAMVVEPWGNLPRNVPDDSYAADIAYYLTDAIKLLLAERFTTTGNVITVSTALSACHSCGIARISPPAKHIGSLRVFLATKSEFVLELMSQVEFARQYPTIVPDDRALLAAEFKANPVSVRRRLFGIIDWATQLPEYADPQDNGSGQWPLPRVLAVVKDIRQFAKSYFAALPFGAELV